MTHPTRRLLAFLLAFASAATCLASVPGHQPLTADQKRIEDWLRKDLQKLASDIGQRNMDHYQGLCDAADYLSSTLAQSGYHVATQEYEVDGKACHNVEAEVKGVGKPDEIVIVGAHYDSVEGTVGANDNGSGAASVLALARAFAGRGHSRTLRFVEFANEEPPYFRTPRMGSFAYAKRCKERKENIVGMVCLETMGYFSNEKGSQRYPSPIVATIFPSTGNFIALVGNTDSKPLVTQAYESFRKYSAFPAQRAALPNILPGVGFSDHWSFWQFGYQAVMVTDTANYRYPYYHLKEDTVDKVQLDNLARVVHGLQGVVEELAGSHPQPAKDPSFLKKAKNKVSKQSRPN